MPSADLERQAREFAAEISELLNATIATGVRMTAVLADSGDRCSIGYRISRRDHLNLEPVPVTISAAPATCHLLIRHELRLDDEGTHLTDARSVFGVYADGAMKQLLMRYDYNRDIEQYPVAHLHVGGASQSLGVLAGRRDEVKPELERQHFPTGGKRFRPCLEDVAEYLVVEGMAEAHSGWSEALEVHRSRFHAIQLRAAVRRDEATAAEQLSSSGWKCQPPGD